MASAGGNRKSGAVPAHAGETDLPEPLPPPATPVRVRGGRRPRLPALWICDRDLVRRRVLGLDAAAARCRRLAPSDHGGGVDRADRGTPGDAPPGALGLASACSIARWPSAHFSPV